MNIGFRGREKARADPDAGRTERKGRRDAAAVGYAAGRQNGQRRDRVDDLRHQRHRAERAAHMAAGFVALRDNQVEAGVRGAPCLVDRADHLDCQCAGVFHHADKAAAVAPEEGYDADSVFEGDRQLLFDREAQHEIRAVRTVRQVVHRREQPPEVRWAAPSARQMADAARVGNGRGELGRCDRTDRSLKDRRDYADVRENLAGGHEQPPVRGSSPR